jgi:hypothetical protein
MTAPTVAIVTTIAIVSWVTTAAIVALAATTAALQQADALGNTQRTLLHDARAQNNAQKRD